MIQYASVHLLQQAAAFMAGEAVLLLSYTSMLLCLWGPTLTFGDKMPKQILCMRNCVYCALAAVLQGEVWRCHMVTM